jgi:hypothetical protein
LFRNLKHILKLLHLYMHLCRRWEACL